MQVETAQLSLVAAKRKPATLGFLFRQGIAWSSVDKVELKLISDRRSEISSAVLGVFSVGEECKSTRTTSLEEH